MTTLLLKLTALLVYFTETQMQLDDHGLSNNQQIQAVLMLKWRPMYWENKNATIFASIHKYCIPR